MSVVRLNTLFHAIVAKSKGVDDYDIGPIPFVTSAESNNGVVAYVTPEEEDRVFTGPALVISGLGFATVHMGEFFPKGNGGDSLTILKPIKKMSVNELIAVAASFNVLHRWRFGFGRKASKGRIMSLEIPFPVKKIDAIWNTEKKSLGKISEGLGQSLLNNVNGFSSVELGSLELDKEDSSSEE